MLFSFLFPVLAAVAGAHAALPLIARQAQSDGDTNNGTAAANATAPRAGIQRLTLANDKTSYYTELMTGEITFRVALDTASSDLWLFSSACSSDTCQAVPRYPLAYASETFVSVNENGTDFSASYSDGTMVAGYVARETVEVANFSVPDHAFGMITDANITMKDDMSGLLGLGFPRLSSISPNEVTNSTPFFTALAQQGDLAYPLFGLSLTYNETGTLSLGAVDSSVVKNMSEVGWNQVVEFAPAPGQRNQSSYLEWAIPMPAFAVNGTQVTTKPSYPAITGNTSLALFDVGNSGIYGPFEDVKNLFSMIDSARLVDEAGQWAIPCDTVVPMTLTFGERNYTLQPSDYMIGPTDSNPSLCLSWPRAVSPAAIGIDWQIGQPFLRTVYSIWSYGIDGTEPPFIGLYPLSNATNSTQNTEYLSSFFSTMSATIDTDLPNSLLPTPTDTIQAYALASTVTAPTGGLMTSGLATSTYSALFGEATAPWNLSAVPTISPPATLTTITVTDNDGEVKTSTSAWTTESVKLGVPPGYNAAPRAFGTGVSWGALAGATAAGVLYNLIV
ncbi:aspartic peptidase domain-containing protein [Schizophyllum amplum]|uniref:Aspartic peptidase domain-containing protein n=1 Tax=Schizophyllum amplum TaxID=97359 RepID=A0A550CX93_9AGAR|nr:aspartic peptidase domain-containing protein [Auriculariopsis ampla]